MATGKRGFARIARHYRFSAVAFAMIAMGAVAYAISAFAAYRGAQQVNALTAARKHDGQAIDAARQAHLGLLELEAGRRAVLIGEHEAFSPHYDHARDLLERRRAALRAGTGAPPPAGLAGLPARLDALLGERIAVSDAKVARARAAEPGAPLHDHTPTAPEQLAELRAGFERLIGTLRARADQRTDQTRDVARATTRIVGWTSVGGTALLGAALALLWRERQLRDLAHEAVQRARAQLEQEVSQRTEALSAAMVRIQSFAGQLDLHVEQERRRLSREVHDQLGQIATVAKIVVGDLGRDHPEVPAAAIAQVTDLLDEAIRTTRRIAAELRPPMLDDLGLGAAASHLVRQVASAGRLAAEVDIRDDDALAPERANQLFRILQEATTNVLRHAQASHLWVTGRFDGAHYRLGVADDGRGPQDVRSDASGLRNMRERAALAGGWLRFGPRPEGGTEVVACIPLEAPPA